MTLINGNLTEKKPSWKAFHLISWHDTERFPEKKNEIHIGPPSMLRVLGSEQSTLMINCYAFTIVWVIMMLASLFACFCVYVFTEWKRLILCFLNVGRWSCERYQNSRSWMRIYFYFSIYQTNENFQVQLWIAIGGIWIMFVEFFLIFFSSHSVDEL